MCSADKPFMINLISKIKLIEFIRLRAITKFAFSLFLFVFIISCQEEPHRVKGITKIAFGSCNKQYMDLTIFETIAKEKPEVWIWLGDIVYGDTENMKTLEGKYNQLKYNESYAMLRDSVKNIIGTWDDHDYGINDGNKSYKFKVESKTKFLNFFDIPKNAPIRKRKGIYNSFTVGDGFKKIKFILLDTRTFQDELTSQPLFNKKTPYKNNISQSDEHNHKSTTLIDSLEHNNLEHNSIENNEDEIDEKNLKNYNIKKSKSKYSTKSSNLIYGKYDFCAKCDLLGDEQWKWLENTLKFSDARINVIVSSIQVIPEEHPFEKWANFPSSRQKLFEMIKNTNSKGVIILSGDRHKAEINKIEIAGVNYPIYEITSSGLTHSLKDTDDDGLIFDKKYRVGEEVKDINFGIINFDWKIKQVGVEVLFKNKINLLQTHKFVMK